VNAQQDDLSIKYLRYQDVTAFLCAGGAYLCSFSTLAHFKLVFTTQTFQMGLLITIATI
jgi:hypothetical protein